MRISKRNGLFGGLALLGLTSMVATGCMTPVGSEEAAPSKPEPVGTTAAAYTTDGGPDAGAMLPNVDCQTTGWNVVQALPVGYLPVGKFFVPIYQGSVSALLANLEGGESNIYQFTSSYYSSIPGAAGYYYLLRNFHDTTVGVNGAPVNDGSYWVSIPIIDAQVDLRNPVPYEPTYPSLENVRFPAYSPGYGHYWAVQRAASGLWPESNGSPMGYWVSSPLGPLSTPYPFELGSDDYTQLTSVMFSPPSNDPAVDARDQTCVLIVDENGLPLDFSAHMSQWDPKPSCAGCYK